MGKDRTSGTSEKSYVVSFLRVLAGGTFLGMFLLIFSLRNDLIDSNLKNLFLYVFKFGLFSAGLLATIWLIATLVETFLIKTDFKSNLRVNSYICLIPILLSHYIILTLPLLTNWEYLSIVLGALSFILLGIFIAIEREVSRSQILPLSKELVRFFKDIRNIGHWLIVLLASVAVGFFFWNHEFPEVSKAIVTLNQISQTQLFIFLKYISYYGALFLILWIGSSILMKRLADETLAACLKNTAFSYIPLVFSIFLPFFNIEQSSYFPISIKLFLFASLVGVSFGLGIYRMPWERVELKWDIRIDRFFIKTVLFLIVAYTFVFSWMSVRAHNSFNTHAYDLGVYDQVIWNTAQGRLFQNSFWGASNFLGVHASIIWLYIAPIYWIWSDPKALLILQSFWIVLGALPLFLLTRDVTKSNVSAFALSLAYLLFVPLQNANLFDVHEIAFVPTLFLFALYFLNRDKYLYFFIFGGLAALAQEEAALSFAFIGIFAFLFKKKKVIGLLAFFLGLGYFIFAVNYLVPHFAGGPPMFLGPFEHLGKSFVDKVLTVLTNPLHVINYIVTPYPEKIESFLHHLIPVGLFPVLGGGSLLLLIPSFSAKYLGLGRNAGIMFHYSAHITTFIFISAVYGLKNFVKYFGKIKAFSKQLPVGESSLEKKILYGCSGFIIVSALLVNWFFSASPLGKDYRLPKIDEKHIEIGRKFIKMVPKKASVVAQTDLVPHLSQRKKIKMFPAEVEYQYILLDRKAANKWPFDEIRYTEEIRKLLQNPKWGVIIYQDGFILFKRGFSTKKNKLAEKELF